MSANSGFVNSKPRSIAIVGGGISGLATAFYLEKARQAGAPLTYTLYEACTRVGGVLGTDRQGGFIVESGADSWVSQKPWARELAVELGLEDQIIPSLDEQRRTYILQNSSLIEIPQGMQMVTPTQLPSILFSKLFSNRAKLRMWRERKLRPTHRSGAEDESIGSFVERHFGPEMVEKIAEPLLAGVFGGDASKLSMQAVLPGLVAMEEEHGSLIRGALAAKKKHAASGSLFTSLRSGMQRLPSAIAEKLPASAVRCGARVREIRRREHGWMFRVGEEDILCDDLVLAVPAPVAGRMLQDAVPPAAPLLDLRYSSCMVVALGYEPDQAERMRLPRGFGFLVPRKEQRLMMACTFVHQKFGYRAQNGCALLRAFIGEPAYETIKQDHDAAIVKKVRAELESILKFQAEPKIARVQRWPLSMPQYEVGHLDRVQQIENVLVANPGLHLVGNAYGGVGVPDCIRGGKAVAEKIVQNLRG